MTRRFPILFRDALAFLSRLASSASGGSGESLAAAVPCYPLAGLVLGLIASAPYLFASSESWIPAWLYVLILAWLTRGLHWDGLADLADACGSNADGERFWRIMKDSRTGAFGVMALVFGITGQVLAARACASAGQWPALIFAPALGRAMVILFGRLTMPYIGSTLAALIQPGARSGAALAAFALTVIAALPVLGFSAFVLAALLTLACLLILARIASAHGGANGDFHGALIIAVETAVLMAAALAPRAS